MRSRNDLAELAHDTKGERFNVITDTPISLDVDSESNSIDVVYEPSELLHPSKNIVKGVSLEEWLRS